DLAGIFMVARLSPLFEYSDAALSFVLVIGATTAFFMGLLGVVHNDIKRVIAYSTLSQLGYMTVALGVSAYGAAIFHLMTHAFFKALLFLAAGSVIIALHHEQDMRRMGGLAKYMPITAVTCWIGALALVGTPFFSGFYSKDAIIEAVGESHRWGATYAYWCVLFGGYFGSSIFVLRANNVVGRLAAGFGGPVPFALHGLAAPPFWLALAGAVTAWACFLWRPVWADDAVRSCGWLYRTLTHKYYFDWFNERILAALTRLIGVGLWKGGDELLIDGAMVNGSAATVGWAGSLLRRVQSGYLYSYAFWMMIGLAVLLGWFLAHARY